MLVKGKSEGAREVFVVQLLCHIWLFVTLPVLQQTRLLCPSLSPRAYSNSCLLSRWCHAVISFSVIPFSCLQSFPASGSFPTDSKNRLFTSGGQNIGASASTSVLSMNIQDWFLLGLTGLISLLSKWLSRVSSSSTVWKHQFSHLCGPTLTSVLDCWKNHSFDHMDICRQSDVSAF